jgi:hypothetical protein
MLYPPNWFEFNKPIISGGIDRCGHKGSFIKGQRLDMQMAKPIDQFKLTLQEKYEKLASN